MNNHVHIVSILKSNSHARPIKSMKKQKREWEEDRERERTNSATKHFPLSWGDCIPLTFLHIFYAWPECVRISRFSQNLLLMSLIKFLCYFEFMLTHKHRCSNAHTKSSAGLAEIKAVPTNNTNRNKKCHNIQRNYNPHRNQKSSKLFALNRFTKMGWLCSSVRHEYPVLCLIFTTLCLCSIWNGVENHLHNICTNCTIWLWA